MRIVFMGTPEFAIPSLQNLIESDEEIIAVITQPDRPKGRSRKITPPPVKKLALQHNLFLLQPEDVNSHQTIAILRQLKPDLITVVAYGQILSSEILEIPLYGCINVHASLLPSYRGAAPIQWAIIKGEKTTGVTTMLMDEGMDTGDILLQKSISIEESDTAATLHDKLAVLGGNLLIETITRLKKGKLIPTPQDDSKASYAPMLTKEDGKIEWTRTSEEIHNLIRGTYPWPGAYTFFNGKRVKILGSEVYDTKKRGDTPGRVWGIVKDGFIVECGKGRLLITQIQPSGKKPLWASDFVNGYNVTEGCILGNRG